MDGIKKNKKRRLPVDDDTAPPLDSPWCVIALLPGDAGYDEMLDKINEECSLCSTSDAAKLDLVIIASCVSEH